MRHPKLPTVRIKGKEYTVVNERVLYFNENYPNGSIETVLVSPPESTWIIVRATVIPDTIGNPFQKFSDYSQAKVGDGYINKTAALENACTSAVGRALGMMGIGVIDAMASADEMAKAGAVAPEEDVFHPQIYDDTPVIQREKPLDPDLRKTAEEMENFVALTKERNQQIQDRLQEITKTNIINRRKLSLFLEREHNGKKSFDVSATQWEITIKKIEDAIAGGEEAVKALLKGEA